MKFETLRNGLANLMGGLLPALVTLLATPFVVNTLGDSSYGALTLITAIIGYFAIIDLNITAGSVKYVAEHHATGNIRLRNQTMTGGLGLYILIGGVGCVLVLLFSDELTNRVFAIPENLRVEVGAALQLAAFGFLFGQVQVYLNSVPQAIRRYDQSAATEALFGVVTPLATVLVLWLGYGLYEVVAVRVVASVLNIGVLAWVIRRLLPDAAFELPTRQTLSALGRFSGFAYLSRLATVAYAQGDKLILGALTTLSTLTYYAVPFMLVNRVFSLTYRLGSVMFPVASALAARQETERLRELYLYAARYVFFINCALAVLLITLAHEILLYWIGPAMAENGAAIMLLITVASLFDSLTNAPSLVNDGLGKPHITGAFAISRAVLGISLTLLLVSLMGVMGAAYAQLVTSVAMASLFVVFVHGRSVPVSLRDYLRVVVAPSLPVMLGAVVLWGGLRGHAPLPPMQTAGVLVIECVLLAAFALLFIFRATDRAALLARLRRPQPGMRT
jgi:O-antigen/teichoic acid export membrane protein